MFLCDVMTYTYLDIDDIYLRIKDLSASSDLDPEKNQNCSRNLLESVDIGITIYHKFTKKRQSVVFSEC